MAFSENSASRLKEQIENRRHNEKFGSLLDIKDQLLNNRKISVQTGLLDLLIDSIKWDVIKVSNGWHIVAELAQLLVQFVAPNLEEITEKHLRETAENLLWRLANLRDEFLYYPHDDAERLSLLAAHETICQSLHKFAESNNGQNANYAFSANNFVPLFTNVDMTLPLEFDLNFLQFGAHFSGRQPNPFAILGSRSRHKIYESLLKRLETAQMFHKMKKNVRPIANISRLVLVLLVKILEANPVEIKWLRKNFGTRMFDHVELGIDEVNLELSQLKNLLDESSYQHKKLLRPHTAAERIQAAWRGYAGRRKLAVAKKTSNHSRRQSTASEEVSRLKERVREEFASSERLLRSEQLLTVCRRSRRFQERRLHIVAALHSSQVERFLREEADVCATKIQSWYRGTAARRALKVRRRNDAAAKIQIWFRRKAIARKRTEQTGQRPTLSEERRNKFQAEIDELCLEAYLAAKADKTNTYGPEETLRLHQLAEQRWQKHQKNLPNSVRRHDANELAIRRLNADMNLMQALPDLKDVTDEEVMEFGRHSTSDVIEFHAGKMHRQLLAKSELGDGEADFADYFDDV